MGDGERIEMKSNLLSTSPILLVGVAMVALAGCSGGGSTPSEPSTYTVGGTLAGLGTSESVSLQDNGGNTLTVSANGSFSFPLSLDAGAAYAVTVKSHTPGIACSVTSGSGTVGSANVTVGVSCGAGTETVLYSFQGDNGYDRDGDSPNDNLIMDSAGNLYGTTPGGGRYLSGLVFKIDATGKETILYSFGTSATDGSTPNGGLIMDSAGSLYGMTLVGGANNKGTVFKIDTTGKETVLYSFGTGATDGTEPLGGLIQDSAGDFYGATGYGGANGEGTVFKIDTTGNETILYSFGSNAADGAGPMGGLIQDSAGDFYGTTGGGGVNNCGTVFKIDATGKETVIYSFCANAYDGWRPEAGLILDSAGNLYGTTAYGGVNSNNGMVFDGTVFKIDTAGKETVLYSFGASTVDGTTPNLGLIQDSAGNLYGTTVNGGANGVSQGGFGTVFKIDTTGAETVLYSFGSSTTPDGGWPLAGLIMDSAGNLYGTTESGGANGWGTVFKID
jgi:uncharacterized repeat protein (TIGR03803 family)